MPAKMIAGIAVHVLTASGAVFGLFALRHAAAHEWALSFFWLGGAAFIDAIDGPLARRAEIEKSLPRFSGARLDLAVDYFTYCVVPAFIVMESGIAGDGLGAVAGGLILLSSLFHFSDLNTKTEDGFFTGFPALWNVVCLYFFVFGPGPIVTMLVISGLAAATFVPVKWVHPVRVRRYRVATMSVMLLWSAAAVYEVWYDFPGTALVQVIFAFTAVYLLAIGVLRSFSGTPSRRGRT